MQGLHSVKRSYVKFIADKLCVAGFIVCRLCFVWQALLCITGMRIFIRNILSYKDC